MIFLCRREDAGEPCRFIRPAVPAASAYINQQPGLSSRTALAEGPGPVGGRPSRVRARRMPLAGSVAGSRCRGPGSGSPGPGLRVWLSGSGSPGLALRVRVSVLSPPAPVRPDVPAPGSQTPLHAAPRPRLIRPDSAQAPRPRRLAPGPYRGVSLVRPHIGLHRSHTAGARIGAFFMRR